MHQESATNCLPQPPNMNRQALSFAAPSDTPNMSRMVPLKKAERCTYIRACYLAEGLKCFGYKTDCAIYKKSNGEFCTELAFDKAMDELIDKTRAKYENLPG